jgi:hypothetical protein
MVKDFKKDFSERIGKLEVRVDDLPCKKGELPCSPITVKGE